MSEDKNRQSDDQQNWPGLSEIDKALHENRLTAYTWKKTWADPWGRLKLVTIFLGLFAFAIFVTIYEGWISV